MVDSGRNSGLPDFLHHKNLTLKKKKKLTFLLPQHLTHRVGDEDTDERAQSQPRAMKRVGRWGAVGIYRKPQGPHRE